MPKLLPPPKGAIVRMYRIGHGDCFLLAFPGKKKDTPVYVLIDCGFKPGSPKFIKTTADEIVANIKEATGGHIDIAIITHEHQDHVNAITEKRFKGISIGQAWFAWTEDGDDEFANRLRKKFKDRLVGLVAARNRLAAAGGEEAAKRIDELLSFELGGEDEEFNLALGLAAADGGGSKNKVSMNVFKKLASAKSGLKFFKPHQRVVDLPGAAGVRVYALGPPRDEEKLKDLDPLEEEQFPDHGLAAASRMGFFADALRPGKDGGPLQPFAARYTIAAADLSKISSNGSELSKKFFKDHYGASAPAPGGETVDPVMLPIEVPDDAAFRRIDTDWLFSAEQLALAMNDETNNASLVLAFELVASGKVLLFVGDAQRGNWVSWADKDWKADGEKVTARDLLGRAVLYKVGHHGSHNATLHGKAGDELPDLSWMGRGDHAGEFTAMITAVRKWAETQKGWDHPQKAIKDALLAKTKGRVFQTDVDFDDMEKRNKIDASVWKAFKKKASGEKLFFDYRIDG
jgi:hypothetical protein